MTISSRGLARTLAALLGPHLPSRVGVEADGADVVVTVDGVEAGRSGAAAIVDDPDGRSAADKTLVAVRAVLAHMQERLAVSSTRPWPADAPNALPLPDAEIRGGTVRAWYGDRDAPTLALRPFRLDDGA